jgi:hypothetical protein
LVRFLQEMPKIRAAAASDAIEEPAPRKRRSCEDLIVKPFKPDLAGQIRPRTPRAQGPAGEAGARG